MDVTKEFEDRESFLNWFVICAISGRDNEPLSRVSDNLRSRPIDVTLTVNGEEINVVHAFKRLAEKYERSIDRKFLEAQELFEEKYSSEMNNLVSNFNDNFETFVSASFNGLRIQKVEEERLKFSEIDEDLKLFTLDKWIEAVKVGAFIDEDGWGYLVGSKGQSNIEVSPSHVKKGNGFADWATHVNWYKR